VNGNVKQAACGGSQWRMDQHFSNASCLLIGAFFFVILRLAGPTYHLYVCLTLAQPGFLIAGRGVSCELAAFTLFTFVYLCVDKAFYQITLRFRITFTFDSNRTALLAPCYV